MKINKNMRIMIIKGNYQQNNMTTMRKRMRMMMATMTMMKM